MEDKKLAVTGSGAMLCKNIIHLKARSSHDGWKEGILDCLEEVEILNLISVSFPALGTGKVYINYLFWTEKNDFDQIADSCFRVQKISHS